MKKKRTQKRREREKQTADQSTMGASIRFRYRRYCYAVDRACDEYPSARNSTLVNGNARRAN